MLIRLTSFAVLSAALLAFAACDAPKSDSLDDKAGRVDSAEAAVFCGGIAAIQCPDGQECILDGNFPDAGGTCSG